MHHILSAAAISLAIGAIHYWNEDIFFTKKKTQEKTMSFVAGASMAYIFLYLLPDLYKGVEIVHQWIFIFTLLGFSLIHLLEKYFYKNVRKNILKLFKGHHQKDDFLGQKEVHFIIFFLYYFSIGIVLVRILKIGLARAILFVLPIVFYAAVSRISFAEIHKQLRKKKILRIFSASATFLGVLAAGFVLQHILVYYGFLGFIIGAYIYIVIIDFIPSITKGEPVHFLFGLTFYTLLITLTWII